MRLREEGKQVFGYGGKNTLGPFDHRTYGFKKLSDLFRAIDLFQVRENKTANQVVVEVKLGKATPKKKAAKKKVAKKYAKNAGA